MATKKKSPTKKANRSTRSKKSVSKPDYWFAAKRYGYGWGKPLTWHGWVVYLTFLASVVWYFAWASNRIASDQTFGWDDQTFVLGGFFLLMAVAVPFMVGICALKGEPARWRWGNTKRK